MYIDQLTEDKMLDYLVICVCDLGEEVYYQWLFRQHFSEQLQFVLLSVDRVSSEEGFHINIGRKRQIIKWFNEHMNVPRSELNLL